MVIFRFFKMAAATILDFKNFKFLTVGTVKKVWALSRNICPIEQRWRTWRRHELSSSTRQIRLPASSLPKFCGVLPPVTDTHVYIVGVFRLLLFSRLAVNCHLVTQRHFHYVSVTERQRRRRRVIVPACVVANVSAARCYVSPSVCVSACTSQLSSKDVSKDVTAWNRPGESSGTILRPDNSWHAAAVSRYRLD